MKNRNESKADVLGRDASGLKEKKLWLLDMDGTIYLGEQIFPETLGFLAKIRENGGRYMMLTNNSSKSVDVYLKKVQRMGIEAGPEDFFTSVHATAQYLKAHHAKERIYAEGTRSFVEQLREAGLDVTEELDKTATVIVLGFDTEMTFERINRTSEMLTGFTGTYIATHPDLVCPTEYGMVPDLGSMLIGFKNATGLTPKVIGKPEPAMIEAAIEAAGCRKEDAVMVGDRVYTDIASGVNAGITTVGVLSGEATLEEMLAAEKKPDFIFRNVGDIL